MLTAQALDREARALHAPDRATLVLAEIDDLPLRLPAPELFSFPTPLDAESLVSLMERHGFLLSEVRCFARISGCLDSGLLGAVETVTRLGDAAVRSAARVAMFSLLLPLDVSFPEARDATDAIRRHSVARACAAGMLCERSLLHADGASAFLCGLLCDLGRLALLARFPKSYVRVLRRASGPAERLIEAEREAFGVDHTVIGGRLAARMGVAPEIVEVIRSHERHLASRRAGVQPAWGAAVRAADRIAGGIDTHGEMRARHGVEDVAESLGVEVGAIFAVRCELGERIRPFLALLEDRPEETASSTGGTGHRPTAPGDDGDRAVVNAVRRYLTLLAEAPDVAPPRRVCAAAAACVREALGIDACVAMLGRRSSDLLHVGVATGRHGCSSATPSRIVPVGSVRLEELVPDARDAAALGPAPPACEWLWERCLGSPAHGPVWLLALTAPMNAEREDWRGGILVCCQDRPDARRHAIGPGMDVLASVISLSASSAFAAGDHGATEARSGDTAAEATAHERERLMSSLAAMAGGAAHELNNPLSVIHGRAQMLRNACTDESAAKELQEIADQAKRASGLVSDLMAFARPRTPRPGTRVLAGLLESRFQDWESWADARGVRLTLIVADASATVYADPEQMGDALDAVVANAVAACAKGAGHVEINSPSRATDERVRIVVTDNGVGMSGDVKAHAFDPFYSYRESGRGMGLGLSRAYRMAEINGGRIHLSTTVGAGTAVTIEIPARSTAPAARPGITSQRGFAAIQ